MTLSSAQHHHDHMHPECVDATDHYQRIEGAYRRAVDARQRRTPICVLYTGRAGDLTFEVGDVEIRGNWYDLTLKIKGAVNGTEDWDLATALEAMAANLRRGMK